MNRGSPRTRLHGQVAQRRFNEAPIHESGKSRCARTCVPGPTGFNEAPIHESGKLGGCPVTSGRLRISLQ